MNMLEEFDYQLNKLKEKLSHSDSRRSHSPQRPRAYENEQRGRDQHDYRGGQDQNHRSRDYHDQRDRRSSDHYDHRVERQHDHREARSSRDYHDERDRRSNDHYDQRERYENREIGYFVIIGTSKLEFITKV